VRPRRYLTLLLHALWRSWLVDCSDLTVQWWWLVHWLLVSWPNLCDAHTSMSLQYHIHGYEHFANILQGAWIGSIKLNFLRLFSVFHCIMCTVIVLSFHFSVVHNFNCKFRFVKNTIMFAFMSRSVKVIFATLSSHVDEAIKFRWIIHILWDFWSHFQCSFVELVVYESNVGHFHSFWQP